MRELAAILEMNFRTVPQRWGATLVVVIGMACAVGALVSILSMSSGFARAVTMSGNPSRVIVMSDGAGGEWGSTISRGDATVLSDMPGLRKDGERKPIVSADYLAYTVVQKKSDGLDAYLAVRGTGPANRALRPEIHLVSGRMFQPGKYEIITGRAAQSLYEGLKEGDRVTMPEGEWLVTGTFETGGSATESELLTDAATLLSAMRLSNYKSMTVLLDRPDEFDRFKRAVAMRPGPVLDIQREPEFLAEQAKWFTDLMQALAYVVGGIMGLGATFGALNTMYSAISARAREIATLRAIGFGGGAVLASVIIEALVFSVAGAAIGIAIAWALFNGNLHDMAGTAIRLAVTAKVALAAAGFACLLGIVGGLFPALKAARMPIADALRAT
jgi:putative ABC transport system permease protein